MRNPSSIATQSNDQTSPRQSESKARSITYWTATVLLGLSILSGGVAELVHYKGNVDGTVVALGYPMYFLTILGAWKIAGALVILAPRLPRLKEWAYAGIFFDVTGAAASHVFAHDYGAGAFHVWVNLAFAALTMISWAWRPSSRILGTVSLRRS